ncbi:GNAT family N-acetyltransferase [Macrococcus sp. DPC7161]|uniref:GNAT family N-acetyltransferase n=1 Tax=Macrococcus sp. DPC7161 TaxID=2507060 RepID=UPI00100BE831|nr:GNAT family N-acetyltransferase [Macrococcus sp. DPC7161]RXK18504.1 N-acetyltransferase [Macrococcus sp. DPC7161]
MTLLETSFTERLEIRPLTSDDYDVWISGFKNRLKKQNAFDSDDIDVSDWDEDFYDNVIKELNELAEKDTAYVLGVFLRDTGEHIGKLEFTVLQRGRFEWGVLGYLIHNQYWNNGYASEMLSVIEQMGSKLKFHRVEAHIHPDNIASIKVIEKHDFLFEGMRKSFMYEDNQWNDYLIFSKIIE